MHGYEMARRIEQQTKGALRSRLPHLSDALSHGEARVDSRDVGKGQQREAQALLPADGSGKKEVVTAAAGMGRAFPRLAKAHEGS